MAWQLTDSNPFVGPWRRLLTRETRTPKHLPTEAEIEMVLSRPTGALAAMGWLLRYTGMRQNEATTLRWPQVDLRKHTLTIVAKHTKTARTRVIEIDDRALAVLSGLPRHNKTDLVFWHGEGQAFSNVPSRFGRFWRAAKKAHPDLPKFTCHDFRHAYAVAELLEGRDLYDLSRHLGHSTVKTTEIYLRNVPGGQPLDRTSARRPYQRPYQLEPSAAVDDTVYDIEATEIL